MPKVCVSGSGMVASFTISNICSRSTEGHVGVGGQCCVKGVGSERCGSVKHCKQQQVDVPLLAPTQLANVVRLPQKPVRSPNSSEACFCSGELSCRDAQERSAHTIILA